ncbi:MAG: diaminopimelate dehydrogenase [Finegoldia sp.]|nr:diaminopimelate dehydrogenase [Finegoldia sp.]
MIKIGILGYGNLGRGVEKAIAKADDMELFGIFSRREISADDNDGKFYPASEIGKYKDDIDVVIMCGSSDKDIMVQGPEIVKNFNVVDSFDTHANIPEYFANMDKIGKESQKLSVISTGWDPGLFSIMRTYADAILVEGNTYTLWGKGLSQGHGAAVRSVEGVKDAVQYTIPKEDFMEKIKNGENPDYSPAKAHTREVFAVLEDGADPAKVEAEIKSIPLYFDEYETTVHFISEEELKRDHSGLPHGGRVIRSGITGDDDKATIEFKLDLQSNPEFTASVNVAYARAIYRLAKEGKSGAMTVLDIAPKYLSPYSDEDLREHFI